MELTLLSSIILTAPIENLEGKRIVLKILRQESVDPEKMYAYVSPLKKGIDAEEYFEI